MDQSCILSSKRKRVQCSKLKENIPAAPGWACSTTLKMYDDPWKIKKVLSTSDVLCNQNRLLLASEVVQDLVLTVLTDDECLSADIGNGTEVKFWDVDTKSRHELVLKRWASSGSFVLVGKWYDEFVKRRSLKKGDEIGLQWDKFNHRFNFSVLFRRAPMFFDSSLYIYS